MKPWDRVAIVGVGLIGGSIGLGLRSRGLAREVVGIARRQASLRAARRMGAVTRGTLNLAAGVRDAELVIVCTPVARIAADARAAAASCRQGALITDVGSTKAQIVQRLDGRLARQVRFVGSHPLAGSEKSGVASALQDLLVGRWVVVTPSRATRQSDCEVIERLWNDLGARVVRMSPDEHDAVMAGISHLPHLVASALAAATPTSDLRLAASGWLDTTRVAAGDPELWRQIFITNRSNVLAALARYEKILASLRQSLESPNAKNLFRILKEGKDKRDALAS